MKVSVRYQKVQRAFLEIPFSLRVIFVLLLLYCLYGVWEQFLNGPIPIHTWRKTDSLTIAWNYSQGNAFFDPETNSISNDGNRKAVAEFPLIYYIIGKLWMVFGHHDWIAKLFYTSFLFSSIVAFSHVIRYLLKSEALTLLFITILFSSPVLVVYMDTGIPNPVSFGATLFSAYFLYRYLIMKKQGAIFGFWFFCSLALLIKVTALIAFLSFAGAAFFYILFHKREILRTHARQILWVLGVFLVAIGLTAWWYGYARSYNAKNGSDLFSTTIRPLWEIAPENRPIYLEGLLNIQIPKLVSAISLVIILVFALVKTFTRFGHNFLRWLLLIQLLGVGSYFIIWFWVFDVHDYYLIEVEFLVLTLLFVVFTALSSLKDRKRLLVLGLASVLSLINVSYCYAYTEMAFDRTRKESKDGILISKEIRELWKWFHFDHENRMNRLREQKELIGEIILEKDTVFCISDNSPNRHLYTIERIGYSNINLGDISGKDNIQKAILKASWMLRVGEDPVDPAVEELLSYCIYENNDVRIYDLKPYKIK